MREAFSITHLLKTHGAPFGAQKANRILLEIGVLEEGERESSVRPGAVRKFKKLSAAGEAWGVTEWNDYGDAQPKFYADVFGELLEKMLARARHE